MRIGKQDQPFRVIATSSADAITVRGRDLCRDLIGKVGFTDYFYFLVTGTMPTEEQRFFTDAVLVAIAEHGLVPSVQAARMTLAAAPEPGRAMAAGLLGVGSWAGVRRRQEVSRRCSPRQRKPGRRSKTLRGPA